MKTLSPPAEGCDSQAVRPGRAPARGPRCLGPFNLGSEQLGVPGPLLIPALLPLSGDSPVGLVSKEAPDNSSFHKPPPLTNASQSRWALPLQSQSLPQSWPCGVWREPPSSPLVLPHALSCQPLGPASPSQPFLSWATSPAPQALAPGAQVGPTLIKPLYTLPLSIPGLSCLKGWGQQQMTPVGGFQAPRQARGDYF